MCSSHPFSHATLIPIISAEARLTAGDPSPSSHRNGGEPGPATSLGSVEPWRPADLHDRGPSGYHNRDEDCAPFLVDDVCEVCGVSHGSSCDECGGCGYHRDGCGEVES